MIETEPDKTPETHQEASARRAAELGALLTTHQENVARAHEAHPTPPGVKFHDLSEAHQKRYNEKVKVIASANTAYCRQVKLACARHRDEDLAVSLKINVANAKMQAEDEAAPKQERPMEPSDARESEGMAR
jgi:hypothetical protein